MGARTSKERNRLAHSRGSAAVWIVLVTAIVAAATAHMLVFTTVVDDAYISFRASANWVAHGAPFYNVGVAEWVPTTFLWVALLAAGHGIHPWPLPLLSQILGGVFGLATIALFTFAPPRGRGDRWVGIVAALLCAVSGVWAAWPLSGMETSLFAFLTFAGAILFVRYFEREDTAPLLWAGAVFGLGAITRPEGALTFAASAVYLAISSRDRRRTARFVLGFAVVAVPYILYMLIVFGTLLPNSYYAKMPGLANLPLGIRYLGGFAGTLRLYFFLPLIVVPMFVGRRRVVSRYLGVVLAVFVSYTAVTGGDFMAFYRFLHPAWPFVCLLTSMGLGVLWQRTRARELWRTAAVLMVAGALWSWAYPSYRGGNRYNYRQWTAQEHARAAIGKWFAGRHDAGEWMAVKPAGIIPFYSGMQAIDFFCLVDRKAAKEGEWVPGAWVGHQRMNASRIHDLAPRVVILEARLFPKDGLPAPNMTDPNHGAGWFRDPRVRDYRPVQAEIEPGLWLNYFVRM